MENSKYEAVRARIVEAYPELMELSFGCKVLIDGGYTPRGEHVVYHKHDEVYEAVNIGHTEIMTNDTTSFTRYKKADYATLKEILGHPIRLSHVLRAIDPLPMTKRYTVMSGGTFVLIHSANAVTSTDITWDMAKDDLFLQSPETIDFLFKILCE